MAGRPLIARGLMIAAVALAGLAAGGASAAAAGPERIYTVAGTGEGGFSGDGGPATRAMIFPWAVAALADGGFLTAEQGARVRRVGPDGTISTVAGTGEAGFSGDGGPATQARISDAAGVAAFPDGSFLIADIHNHRVRRVSADGTITTVAGNGRGGTAGDGGPATSADLVSPIAVAAFPDGSFVIGDLGAGRVRRVDPDGVITTVAGDGAAGQPTPVGGSATGTAVAPRGLAALPDGGFLIADVNRNVVWRVDAGGGISAVAGTGEQGFSGDGGLATAARLSAPLTVASLPDGGFVVGDGNNSLVRRVDPAGIISTAAGRWPGNREQQDLWAGGYSIFDGGLATGAPVDALSVSALADGALLVAGGNRVRLVAGPSTHEPGLAFGDPSHDRVHRSRYATHLSLSRPARVRIDALRRSRSVAHRSFAVPRAGWTPAGMSFRFGTSIYGLQATARTPGGRTTTQLRYSAFGGRLLRSWAAEIATHHAHEQGAAPVTVRVPRCHRFSATRVDCETQAQWDTGPSPEPQACTGIDEIVLRRDGQIHRRSYACPTPLKPSMFKLHPPVWGFAPPGWSRGFRPADLSALAG